MLTQSTSLCLVSELVDDLRGRADEREAGLLDLARELCVLGEETISTTYARANRVLSIVRG